MSIPINTSPAVVGSGVSTPKESQLSVDESREAKRKRYAREYHVNNREKRNAWSREYRQQNLDAIRRRERERYSRNLDAIRMKDRNRRQRERYSRNNIEKKLEKERVRLEKERVRLENKRKRIESLDNRRQEKERAEIAMLENKRKRIETLENTREERRLLQKEKSRQRYIKNRERHLKVSREWVAKNRQKNRAYQKKWRVENREKLRLYDKKRKSEGPTRIAVLQRKRLKNFIKSPSVCRSEMFGCTPDQLARHIESQFVSGMSWTNTSKWHIDHIMPCSAFDLSNPDQVKICFNWQNLRPLWAKKNLRKGKKITHPQLCLPIGIAQQTNQEKQ